MPYIYMDLMKQAIPGDHIKKNTTNEDPDIHFAVFGTYDWLHCRVQGEFPTTIWELKGEHEKRHKVCWNYERQPIFLYFCDENSDKVRRICDNRHEQFGSRPLVMTLLQVEKHSLCDRQIELDGFLAAFQKKAEAALLAEKISQSDIEICVCWNLSGSDILILSRPKRISIVYEIIKVLQREGIRVRGIDGDKDVPVFSFSSHCAFPCDSRIASESINSRYHVDRDAVVEWLRSEDESFSLISFVETSYSYDGIVYSDNSYQVLFGERDYRLRLKSGDVEQIANVIADRLNDQKAEVGGKYRFRSSYLVPGIFVNNDAQQEKSLQSIVFPEDSLKEEETYEIYDNLKARYDGVDTIVRAREDVFGKSPANAPHPVSQQIFYCTNSLLGILKYAMRLQATINQYDLYCYIIKLYRGFDSAVARYEEKIAELDAKIEREVRTSDDLRNVVSDLVVQSMRFVSELQHLFSVLALSPHNYMETYSSSMRSLNAASKLWGAYSGLIEKLSFVFRTKVGGKTQECTVMLSPYRERKSQNSMFLSAFAEEKTLVLLQMNFALMFRPQMAVFMIAHECGHHFSDHYREMRFACMTKAFFSYALEAAFLPFYTAPLHLLVSVEDRAEGGNEAIARNYYQYVGVTQKDYKDEEDYRSLLGIHLLNFGNREKLEELYDEWRNQLQADYKEDFAAVLNALYFSFKDNYDRKKGPGWKANNFFGEVLQDSYKNIKPEFIEAALHYTAHEISKKNRLFVENLLERSRIDGISYDLNQMARLNAFWADKCADYRNKRILSAELKGKIGKAARHTVMLFREIYADIFAVLVLDMSLDDYKSIILAFSDMYAPLLQNPITIRRMYAVFDAVYGAGCSLITWIKSDACLYAEDVKKVAIRELYALESSITKDYICEYGRYCADNLRKKIADIQVSSDGREALAKMRSLALYKDDGDFINSLWYFWKGAMTS